MSLTAIVLVIVSAGMHAGWNLLSKSRMPSASFFLISSLTGFVMLSPLLIAYHHSVVVIPFRVWALLITSGCFMALYYAGLAGAYRAGDMSIAYPLARSSPVIVVTVVTVLLGRGDQVSTGCVIGIVFVVGGCFLIPMKRFLDLQIRNYLNATCLLALLAAIGTTGYSILDDEALRHLRAHPEIGIGAARITLIYACIQALTTSVWLMLFVGPRSLGRESLRRVFRNDLRHAMLAGVVIHITYGIVLIALAFARNVSYVVAFRQLSIPLGAMVAILLFKEPVYRPKLAGIVIMLTGLVLVATQ